MLIMMSGLSIFDHLIQHHFPTVAALSLILFLGKIEFAVILSDEFFYYSYCQDILARVFSINGILFVFRLLETYTLLKGLVPAQLAFLG